MPKIPNTLVLLAITIAVLFFIGYLWYRKFTGGTTEVNGKPLVEPSEYINLLVGLISLAVAVVFGLVATNLSNKANKYSEASFALANKQDSLHEELNELRNLASGQQEQLNELLRIVVRLDKQNQLSVSQINELKLVTSNLGEQTNELRALNTKQVEVSETISNQFAVNSGVLQYMIQNDSKKFQKAYANLKHAVSQILQIQSPFHDYRDITLDSLLDKQKRDFWLDNVLKASAKAISIMDKNSGNDLLFIESVGSSWGITYSTFNELHAGLLSLVNLKNPGNQEFIKMHELINRFAFLGYQELNDLSVNATTAYEEIFQLDKNFLEKIKPTY